MQSQKTGKVKGTNCKTHKKTSATVEKKHFSFLSKENWILQSRVKENLVTGETKKQKIIIKKK